jgi:hypothetical protein
MRCLRLICTSTTYNHMHSFCASPLQPIKTQPFVLIPRRNLAHAPSDFVLGPKNTSDEKSSPSQRPQPHTNHSFVTYHRNHLRRRLDPGQLRPLPALPTTSPERPPPPLSDPVNLTPTANDTLEKASPFFLHGGRRRCGGWW